MVFGAATPTEKRKRVEFDKEREDMVKAGESLFQQSSRRARQLGKQNKAAAAAVANGGGGGGSDGATNGATNGTGGVLEEPPELGGGGIVAKTPVRLARASASFSLFGA